MLTHQLSHDIEKPDKHKQSDNTTFKFLFSKAATIAFESNNINTTIIIIINYQCS